VLLSTRVLKTSHPVRLGGLLVAVAIINSIFLGKLLSRWLFYILFLVFLGGVIVVLLFIVSICGNEKFFYVEGSNGLYYILAVIVIYPFMLWEMGSGLRFVGLNLTISLYQSEMILGFVIFMLILVLCLIRVVKIRRLESGPLVKRL
jgi:hypothetical protein